ncbi:hypothetical protein [Leucobacter edaphi]|uniref:hypothetical protein n=1 Tax=Leucobacter edaphi TaxID=2796472 RepID=UPI0034E290C9
MSNSERTAPQRPAAAPSEGDATAVAAETDAETRADRLGGLGRVLIAVYIVLALGATFRSIYQIISKFNEAPLAYSLSALSGIVYIVASIALIKRRGVWRRIAWGALIFELAGVLIVGALSIFAPQLFAHPSVWSGFGSGYLYIPLVLPVLGLIWLSRTGKAAQA